MTVFGVYIIRDCLELVDLPDYLDAQDEIIDWMIVPSSLILLRTSSTDMKKIFHIIKDKFHWAEFLIFPLSNSQIEGWGPYAVSDFIEGQQHKDHPADRGIRRKPSSR